MIPYFFSFALASIFLLNPIKLSRGMQNLLWICAIIYGALFIGLRYEVGGDWLNYSNGYDQLSSLPFDQWFNISRYDIGYIALTLISSYIGMGVMGVNIIAGFIVMTCLVSFAKKQPLPWAVIVIAIPFFIIGINMGTVRQGLALSFILVALTHLNTNIRTYCMWVFIAMLFHKSAFLMFGMAFLTIRNSYALLLLSLIGLLLVYIGSQLYSVKILFLSYIIGQEYQSDGALIRVLVSVLPFFGSLVFYKKINAAFPDNWIYMWIGLGTLVLLIFSSSFSTLVDRLAYYTIPLQLALWPRIIAVQETNLLKSYMTFAVISGYLLILYVWLVFANHSWAWIPYQIFWPGESSASPSTLCLNGYCDL
tara:strand:+ start:3282 stop:4376 length:1095 start_codon:yes stop_codon:yes gene_type:complete